MHEVRVMQEAWRIALTRTERLDGQRIRAVANHKAVAKGESSRLTVNGRAGELGSRCNMRPKRPFISACRSGRKLRKARGGL